MVGRCFPGGICTFASFLHIFTLYKGISHLVTPLSPGASLRLKRFLVVALAKAGAAAGWPGLSWTLSLQPEPQNYLNTGVDFWLYFWVLGFGFWILGSLVLT